MHGAAASWVGRHGKPPCLVDPCCSLTARPIPRTGSCIPRRMTPVTAASRLHVGLNLVPVFSYLVLWDGEQVWPVELPCYGLPSTSPGRSSYHQTQSWSPAPDSSKSVRHLRSCGHLMPIRRHSLGMGQANR